MGLHTFHLNLATGVRWTSRAVAIFAVIGYLAEWFWPPAGRDYLRLAWQSLLIWARGGAPAASVPRVSFISNSSVKTPAITRSSSRRRRFLPRIAPASPHISLALRSEEHTSELQSH